jgi:hypothetical protein
LGPVHAEVRRYVDGADDRYGEVEGEALVSTIAVFGSSERRNGMKFEESEMRGGERLERLANGNLGRFDTKKVLIPICASLKARLVIAF